MLYYFEYGKILLTVKQVNFLVRFFFFFFFFGKLEIIANF